MTVYLDVVFAVNSLLNYLLLLASGHLGGGRLRRLRLLGAAALGGLYSVFALLPGLAILNSVGVKILISALMILAGFGAQKKSLRLGALFWALACCFAGAVFGITKLFRQEVIFMGGGMYYPVSAFGLILVAAAAWLLLRLLFSGLCLHSGSQIVPLRLCFGKYAVPLRALLDTGNTLRDPITNEPVLVVNWRVLAELLPHLHLRAEEFTQPDALLRRLRTAAPELKTRLIPYKAVGVQTGLLLAAKLRRDAGAGTVLAAFSPNAVSDGGNYEALMGETL